VNPVGLFFAILRKIVGSKHERDLKRIRPVVDEINRIYDKLGPLTDEEILKKTESMRREIAEGRSVDDCLPEAYALAKLACRKLVGKSWPVCGIETPWEMVPFDVQLVGAVALHEGRIAEMATGEGKTLVAVMPMYLNALTGKGVHLVTVNDYLAKRDSEWMGKVFELLGVSVGCIQTDMHPDDRRRQYECDITYGTNNEFGFDYLRDNMAVRLEDRVQRGHHYAIVDEVDSVLIDEARTPLIISGPVEHSTQKYNELKPRVEKLVRNQTRLVNQLVAETEKLIREGDRSFETGARLLKIQRGAPKNKRFLKLMTDGSLKKLMERVELELIRDKKLSELDQDLYYSIDEKTHVIDLSDKGREALSPDDKNLFVLPDLSVELGKIEEDDTLSPQEKLAKREAIHRLYADRSEKIHNILQLLKGYSLFEKDVEYVVKDGRVIIVDEFTGRLMPGRRFSDGLHQALEAKENVKVEQETQTFATITLQNYFRMYEKLAGMTGTAETEACEFYELYKLDVMVIPTHKPVRRIDYNDVVFRTRREKYNAVIEEIVREHEAGRPVLVGTVSVEVSETLSRLLKRKGIKHSVLNAKYHQQEAEIIKDAGQPGAVTIATNMAGRGTDIKLGPGVVKCKKCCIRCEDRDCENCDHPERAEECAARMPCGLHIVGTERHESRRIDRQLRGRSGRQGDPGSSRFFLSLEDDLMRLFGSDRVASAMDRMGVGEGEVIEHGLVTKAIERAQKRVEAQNFEIRKHLLEYDNVMNQQREVIYSLRLNALEGQDLRSDVLERIDELVERKFDERVDPKVYPEEWDLDGLSAELESIFLVPFDLKGDKTEELNRNELFDHVRQTARTAYEQKESLFGPELMREVERYVYLKVIDEHWRDHLYELDQLKGGIGLRAYGQRDPLLEYKSEAYRMFVDMTESMREDSIKQLFRVSVERRAPEPEAPRRRPVSHLHAPVSAFAAAGAGAGAAAAGKAAPPVRRVKKVGRNDPCPCGSGKKYKKCCGR